MTRLTLAAIDTLLGLALIVLPFLTPADAVSTDHPVGFGAFVALLGALLLANAGGLLARKLP